MPAEFHNGEDSQGGLGGLCVKLSYIALSGEGTFLCTLHLCTTVSVQSPYFISSNLMGFINNDGSP